MRALVPLAIGLGGIMVSYWYITAGLPGFAAAAALITALATGFVTALIRNEKR